MTSKLSAGLLAYRIQDGRLEVWLAHPGGPFFASKDAGHWTIPKGEIEGDEDPLKAAIREFTEEIGIEPAGEFLDLATIQQKGGKIVHAWAHRVEWQADPPVRSNRFEIEWPPHSGQKQSFPEVDRARFFPLELAREKIKETQRPFLDRLVAALETGVV